MHPIILTVLRGGGEYHVGHVEKLRDQCMRHAPGIEFACLSREDVPGKIEALHDWPHWWCKMEMFRLPGPVLYMDLDTVITGNLGPLLDTALSKQFTVLRDFNPHARDMGSGLMAWSGDMGDLYRAFKADPARHMAENNSGRWLGDQGFIERHTSARSYWQVECPGAVVSWKKHCQVGIPGGARVVCFHGKPRPWDTNVYEAI